MFRNVTRNAGRRRGRTMVLRPVVTSTNENPEVPAAPAYVNRAFRSNASNQFNFLHWTEDERRSRQRKELDATLLKRIFPKIVKVLNDCAPWVEKPKLMYGDNSEGIDYFVGVDLQNLVHDVQGFNFVKFENVIRRSTTTLDEESQIQE